jgi:hypothetical protein
VPGSASGEDGSRGPAYATLIRGPFRAWRRSVRISDIIWLDDFVDKLRRKHAVEPEEVEEVLAGRPYFFFAEKGHLKGENIYGAFG